MNARLLDVFHDPADDHRAGPIGDGVDVELERVFEELVDEHGMLGRRVDGVRHIAVERRGVVDDGHRASAEDVRRPHDDRESDVRRDDARFFARRGRAALGLCDVQLAQEFGEAFAILGEVDGIR